MSNITADKLRELKKLLDEGIITHEEFEDKKKDYLNEVSFSDKDLLPSERKEMSQSCEHVDNSSIDKNRQLNVNQTDYNNISPHHNETEIFDLFDDSVEAKKKNPPEDEQASKINNFKIGVVLVAIVAIVTIFGMYMSQRNKEINMPQTAKQTEQKGPTQEQWQEFDNKSWEDFKEINEKLNNLQKTIADKSSTDRTEKIENAEHYFSDKKATLNYTQNNMQENHIEPMKIVCEKAEDICASALKANSYNNESAMTEIANKITDLTKEVSVVAKNRDKILIHAGYTESEIKDILNKIKDELKNL